MFQMKQQDWEEEEEEDGTASNEAFSSDLIR
jgi:hypothetical protein